MHDGHNNQEIVTISMIYNIKDCLKDQTSWKFLAMLERQKKGSFRSLVSYEFGVWKQFSWM